VSGAVLLLAVIAAGPPTLHAEGLAVMGADPPRFHTELLATYPAADSVHASAIREIRLRFSTAVQVELSTLTVLGPAGVIRTADSLRHVRGSDERELRLPLPGPLSSGAYRVEWRTAGPDGHALRGDFGFQVAWDPPAETGDTAAPGGAAGGAAAGAGAVAPGAMVQVRDGGEATSDGRFVGALARWLGYLTMIAGLGGALFHSLVLPRLGADSEAVALRTDIGARMTTLAWAGVAAGLVALPLALGVRSVQTFGEGGLSPVQLTRVAGSGWGAAWFVQLAGVALLALGLLGARRWNARWGWLLAGAAGVLVAVAGARAGHAAGRGGFTMGVQALHASAAAVWVGGLVLLVAAVLPATRKRRELLPRAVDAFSPMALTAVLVLVVTGALNSWDRLDGPATLVSSTFGRVLLLKLTLFAGAASLGFHNWRTVRPALRDQARTELLRVPASLEMLLGLTVLAVTAVLVAIPLP
jgi:copper transport protein